MTVMPTEIRQYLKISLAMNTFIDGFVDAYTGPEELWAEAAADPALATPRDVVRAIESLQQRLAASELGATRTAYLTAHLRALRTSARKLAGDTINFIDEVSDYFDISPIEPGVEEDYREAHRLLAAELPGTGHLGERYAAYRESNRIRPEDLGRVVEAVNSALREAVRRQWPLQPEESIEYELVGDKPWSGFNYYRGRYRSVVAINTDLPQYLNALPQLIAHESYPGHHTEHVRKEKLLVEGEDRAEHTVFVVNTPQCLMAEGLADHALGALVGEGWGGWATDIYAELGLHFDGLRAERIARAQRQLNGLRQDAALQIHDQGKTPDEVVEFLLRWGLMDRQRATQSLRFLTDPLWRAYISTYVEGYALVEHWLARGPRLEQFGRLLDEPLLPSQLITP